MKKLLNKLKSQKGATGTDVLVSAAIIVLSIGIVSMMYVNTSVQSRNITRTAGATRIATNLIENIDAMSYEDFLSAYGTTSPVTIVGSASQSFLNTSIPNGFTVEVKAEKVFGSHTTSSEQFDLVRQIEVTVSYPVGKVTENVKFNTVKQRELIEECNAPATADLSLLAGMSYYPIKYVQTIGAYVKTTEDDPEWYDYTNKNWATVIVSNVAEDSLFDVNGKFIGTINATSVASKSTNTSYIQKYVWIPKFFTEGTESTSSFTCFSFRDSTNQRISESELASEDGTSKFKYYKASNIDSTDKDNVNLFSSTLTGMWAEIAVSSTNVQSFESSPAQRLNESGYGPYNMH